MTAAGATRSQAAGAPLVPRPFRVLAARPETADTTTVTIEPADGAPLAFAAGQFTMLGTFGGARGTHLDDRLPGRDAARWNTRSATSAASPTTSATAGPATC